MWDVVIKEIKFMLRGGYFRGVCLVDFFCIGKYIVSVDLVDDY